jgi:ubiquinone/menaquinone biosynthesis C-methylase UbiE
MDSIAAIKKNKSVQKLYRWWAPYYDGFRVSWRKIMAEGIEGYLEKEILTRFLFPQARILDLGCGTGANPERLLRLNLPFAEYVGIDLTEEMLEIAKQKAQGLSQIKFFQGDIHNLPFVGEEFDLVISTWAFEHLAQPERVAREALRVLKRGGRVVLLFSSLPSFPLRLVISPIELFLRMKCLTREQYLAFPHLQLVRSFAGGFETLVVLEKQVDGEGGASWNEKIHDPPRRPLE